MFLGLLKFTVFIFLNKYKMIVNTGL